MAAYVSALLGLESTTLFAGDDGELNLLQVIAHGVLVLGYFAAVVIAFIGTMKFKWNENTPPLLRSVVGTGLGVVVAVIGLLASETEPSQASEPSGGEISQLNASS